MDSTELTLEQQFTIANFKQIVQGASKEQLEVLYIELLTYHLRHKNLSDHLLKQHWGINELNTRTAEEERRDEGTNYQAS